MRRTLFSCLRPCLCVAWCPGGVCCAWCSVSVAASSSAWPRSWVPLSCFQPSTTVNHMSVYGDMRFCFAFSFRIHQRLGDSCGGGGVAAELLTPLRAATSNSQGSSPRWRFLRSSSSTVSAPCRELIQRFHGCSSWTRLFLNLQE